MFHTGALVVHFVVFHTGALVVHFVVFHTGALVVHFVVFLTIRCNGVYCTCVCAPGHDPLTFFFFFLSPVVLSLFLIGWEFYVPDYLKC